MSTIQDFRAARRAGVPLVAIATDDPQATMDEIVTSINGKTTIAMWDCIRGVVGLNSAGESLNNPEVIGSPSAMLMMVAPEIPENSILFVLAADEFLDDPPVKQGIWNLRSSYKATRRTLVLLGKSFSLPPRLANDIVVIDQSLPNDDELGRAIDIVDEAAVEAKPDRPRMAPEQRSRVIDSVRGLPFFAAEQIVAMSTTPEGIDEKRVWEAKCKQVEQQEGVSIWRGGETFEDIGGLNRLKTFSRQIISGRRPPKGIVFIDEIEKLLAGSSTTGGDTSGVSQGMLQSLLTYMQDKQVVGMILIGPPGTGKSMIAKAFGNEGKVPTISLDTNAMKGSLVGQSERTMRGALKVVSSVTSDQSLWIATCNSISSLPPELRRRFTLGTFFVDLPDEEERLAIWRTYLTKWNLNDNELPNHTGWTGAEIRNCCHIAWMLNITPTEAATYIVPVSVSAKSIIDKLRKECDGCYLSASYEGLYRMSRDAKSRKMDLED